MDLVFAHALRSQASFTLEYDTGVITNYSITWVPGVYLKPRTCYFVVFTLASSGNVYARWLSAAANELGITSGVSVPFGWAPDRSQTYAALQEGVRTLISAVGGVLVIPAPPILGCTLRVFEQTSSIYLTSVQIYSAPVWMTAMQ